MPEDFIFDERDFALADQNETRKIWAEKYLEGPGRQEAEHFALYRTCQSALIEKLKNEAHTPFVVPGPLDPSVDSSTTLRLYAWPLDRGERLVGLTLKSGHSSPPFPQSTEEMDAVFFIFCRCRRSR